MSDAFWTDAFKAVDEQKDKHHYRKAGAVLADHIIDGLGGPIAHPAKKSKGIDESFMASELAAGFMYGVSEAENWDQLSPCFNESAWFVENVLRSY